MSCSSPAGSRSSGLHWRHSGPPLPPRVLAAGTRPPSRQHGARPNRSHMSRVSALSQQGLPHAAGALAEVLGLQAPWLRLLGCCMLANKSVYAGLGLSAMAAIQKCAPAGPMRRSWYSAGPGRLCPHERCVGWCSGMVGGKHVMRSCTLWNMGPRSCPEAMAMACIRTAKSVCWCVHFRVYSLRVRSGTC